MKKGGMTKQAKAKARAILAAQHGWQCHYCGANLIPDGEAEKYCDVLSDGLLTPKAGWFFPELDHKQPASRGGANDIGNLVLSCGTCNHTKNDKTQEEFEEWRLKV